MIINKLITFYFILIGGILFGGSPIRDAAEKYIISQFDVDVSIYMHTLKLDAKLKALVQNKVKQRFYRNELYYWTISNNETTIAYAIMDNVLGKSMPITFLVIVEIDGRIINSEVMDQIEEQITDVLMKIMSEDFVQADDICYGTTSFDLKSQDGTDVSWTRKSVCRYDLRSFKTLQNHW